MQMMGEVIVDIVMGHCGGKRSKAREEEEEEGWTMMLRDFNS